MLSWPAVLELPVNTEMKRFPSRSDLKSGRLELKKSYRTNRKPRMRRLAAIAPLSRRSNSRNRESTCSDSISFFFASRSVWTKHVSQSPWPPSSRGTKKNMASDVWQYFGIIFLRILVISYVPGGHQDLLPGLYQVFTFIYFGISRFQRETLTTNLPEDSWKKNMLKLYYVLLYVNDGEYEVRDLEQTANEYSKMF